MPLNLKQSTITSVLQSATRNHVTLSLPGNAADNEVVFTASFTITNSLQDGTPLGQPEQVDVSITQAELDQLPKWVGIREDLIQLAYRGLKAKRASLVA